MKVLKCHFCFSLTHFTIYLSPTAQLAKIFGHKISHNSAAFLDKGSNPALASVL